MSKKFTDVGELRQRNVKNEAGEVIGKKSYLVVDSNIKILKGRFNSETKTVGDYQEVDLGQYRTIELLDPKSGIDGLLAKDYITEEEHQKRMTRLEEKNVKYKLSIPPTSK